MRFGLFILVFLLHSLYSCSQSVLGGWYGTANVKTNTSASNYLVEMILQPESGAVKGVLNYYFKNTFRSIQVRGSYNGVTRQLVLKNVPVVYYGSMVNYEVDCVMDMFATLRVARTGSTLTGSFFSHPEYKYVCPEIRFSFSLDHEVSGKDSVAKAIREFKETYQVWKPAPEDTAVAVTIIPRKVTNYVIERQYHERQNVVANEIEVDSDSLKVDFFDNGEIDGDSISIFFNNKLIAFNRRLSTKSVHFDIVLDSLERVNEITMFAENLGSIPPNTALMLISDGVNRYDVRLSSSLEKNATIRIKRKKDGIRVPK